METRVKLSELIAVFQEAKKVPKLEARVEARKVASREAKKEPSLEAREELVVVIGAVVAPKLASMRAT